MESNPPLLIVILFGIFQSILLSLYFYKNDTFRNPTKLLSLAFLILSFIFIFGLIFSLGLNLQYPHLSRIGLPIGALIAPIFAAGVEAYYGYPRENRYWKYISFSAAIFIAIYLFPYYTSSSDEKYSNLISHYGRLDTDCILMNLVSILSNWIIFVRLYFRLHVFSKEFNKELINDILKFKKLVLYGILVITISFIIFLFKRDVGSESLSNALFAIWVLVFAWNQVYVRSFANHQTIPASQNDKYSKSLLNSTSLIEYGLRIEEFFKIRDNIMNPSLNLESISRFLGVSTNLTSQVINRHFGKTFLELLREHRIILAKDLLKNSDYSILRIGLEIGYNSKSSFLRAFRDQTGITPSSYRNDLEN